MTQPAHKIISHGSIYLAGNLLRYSVSFIMLPIYTRLLTPSDYGTIELLSMMFDFVGIICGLKIGQALFRFYADYTDERNRGELLSTAVILAIGLNLAGVTLVAAASGPLSMFVFGVDGSRSLLLLLSLTLLFQPLIEIPMAWLRVQQKPWHFISFSSLKLLLQLGFNIYFVVILGLKVEGVIYSAILTSASLALLLGSYCLRSTGIRFSRKKASDLVAFSWPLVLASVVAFYVTFGDRYFLKLFYGLDEVGIYALGYKFGFLLSFVATTPFLSIWDSERYRILQRPDAKAQYQKIFLFYCAFSISVAVLIAVFSRNVLMIMSAPAFWSAHKIVPIVLIAYLFQGLTAYCNFGILLEKKTTYITRGSSLAAVVITVGFALLIPQFGAVGAAWSAVFAFAARWLYVYLKARQFYDMELRWGKVLMICSVSLPVVILALAGPDRSIALAMLMNVGLVAMFLVSLVLLPIFPNAERVILRRILLRPWRVVSELRTVMKGA